jgi:hypothetical protein
MKTPTRYFLASLGFALAAAAGTAHAQNTVTTGIHEVTVTPATAAANVSRTVTITVWAPSGCGPRNARLDTSQVNAARVLVVAVDPGLAPAPCVLLLVPHVFNLMFTPQNEGELKVLAVTTRGAWLTETTLVTRDTPTLRSRFDLTGMWYDPATNGSGLTFVHAAPRNDAVFGTWFLYDAQRNPRWYTIQNVFWKPGGLEAEGVLYSASAAINVCPLTIIGCPTAATLIAPMARARIAMQSATTARIEALRPDGSVIFSSNIVKGEI